MPSECAAEMEQEVEERKGESSAALRVSLFLLSSLLANESRLGATEWRSGCEREDGRKQLREGDLSDLVSPISSTVIFANGAFYGLISLA